MSLRDFIIPPVECMIPGKYNRVEEASIGSSRSRAGITAYTLVVRSFHPKECLAVGVPLRILPRSRKMEQMRGTASFFLEYPFRSPEMISSAEAIYMWVPTGGLGWGRVDRASAGPVAWRYPTG